MATINQDVKLELSIDNQPQVLRQLTGREKISRCFQLRAIVEMEQSEVSNFKPLEKDAELSVYVNDTEIHTIECKVSQANRMRRVSNNRVRFSVVLVPELWFSRLAEKTHIFSNNTFQQTLSDLMTHIGITFNEPVLTGSDDLYKERPICCQYKESDFNFLNRILESRGAFYYFQHAMSSQPSLQPGLSFTDDLPDIPVIENVIVRDDSWTEIQKTVANKVVLKGYDFKQPGLAINSEAVLEGSLGDRVVYYDSEVLLDQAEADAIAEIRLEELQAFSDYVYFHSLSPELFPGCRFEYVDDEGNLNTYLVVLVRHHYVFEDVASNASSNGYRNFVVAIKSDVKYRPLRKAQLPVIVGTETGFIHSDYEDALTPMISDEGLYSIRVNYTSDADETILNNIRMQQPVAGLQDGFFFPLKKDVEVIIGFSKANPDLPYIQGAMSNGSFASLVNSKNSDESIISSAHILKLYAEELLRLESRGGWYRRIEVNDFIANQGEDFEDQTFNIMNNAGVNAVTAGDEMTLDDETSGEYVINRVYGDQYTWVDGISYEWDNKPGYYFGNGYDEIHEGDEMSILQTERFAIPYMPVKSFQSGNQSFYEDREDGLITKQWGNEFEYKNGRNFAWSAGPGPGGSFSTFSYGNGYTENLIGVTDSRSSLDQAGGQRGEFSNIKQLKDSKHDHWKEYEEAAASYKDPGNGPVYDYDELPEDKIDPGRCVFDKTWGATYNYQKGFTLDVHEGKSVSKAWGDSHEERHGDSHSVTHGRADEQFLGGKSEFVLAGVESTSVAATNENYLGLKTEIEVAGKITLATGASLDVQGGFSTEVKGSHCRADALKLEDEITSLKNKKVAVVNTMTKLEKAQARLKNCGISIASGAMTLFS